jgi:hypothetical protein
MVRLLVALALLLAAVPASAQSPSALSGEWQGDYTYTDSRPPVNFLLEATFDGAGRLSGSISEPNTFGSNDVSFLHAYVSGAIDGNVVRFTKTYDGTGGQSGSVIYEGVLDPSTSTIAGTWRIGDLGGQFAMKRVR